MISIPMRWNGSPSIGIGINGALGGRRPTIWQASQDWQYSATSFATFGHQTFSSVGRESSSAGDLLKADHGQFPGRYFLGKRICGSPSVPSPSLLHCLPTKPETLITFSGDSLIHFLISGFSSCCLIQLQTGFVLAKLYSSPSLLRSSLKGSVSAH